MRKLVFLLLMMMTVLSVSFPANARFFRGRTFKPVSVRTNIGPKVNPRLYYRHVNYIQYTPTRVSQPNVIVKPYKETRKMPKHEIPSRSLPVVHIGSLPVPLSHYDMTLFHHASTPSVKPIFEETNKKEKKKVNKEEVIRTLHDVAAEIYRHTKHGGDGQQYDIQLPTDTTENDSIVIDYTIYFE